MRLLGFAWYFKDGPDWLYPIHLAYTQNAFLILLSFVPTILAFSALLFVGSERKKGSVLFFLILALLGLFLMKGIAPPFGELFNWFLNQNSVFLYFFKTPFNKMGLIATLSFAVLIGFAVNSIGKKVKHKWGTLLVVLLASFAVSGLIFPYWSGNAIRPILKVDIPSAYAEVGQYLSANDSTSRVLSLPIFQITNFQNFNWGYCGAGIEQYFIPNPLLIKSFEVGSLETEKAIALFEEVITSNDAFRFAGLCRQYGIGEIVYHNDANPDFYHEDLHIDSLTQFSIRPHLRWKNLSACLICIK